MAGKASGKTVERLVVVDETQADRQTIEIYELVTRKMRVGRVPLLFKALAAEKALVPAGTRCGRPSASARSRRRGRHAAPAPRAPPSISDVR